MNKNLIYYSVGGHIQYIDMLKIHLQSLFKNLDIDTDLLFITSTSFAEYIQALLSELNLPIKSHFFIVDTENVKKASASKLKIYNWPLINQYEKIFYCDIDTIWTSNISDIFNVMQNEEDFYVSNERGLIGDGHYFGQGFFSTEEIKDIKDKDIKSINAGVFGLFNRSIPILQEIEEFMMANLAKMNACIEQPYCNYILYRRASLNSDLNNFVSNDRETVKTLMHFPGGPGNYKDKLQLMTKFCNLLGIF